MVNEERIKLMTRMAAYEKEGHKKNQKRVSYFKSDYISMQMLKSVIATTIAFGIMFGLYVLYDFESYKETLFIRISPIEPSQDKTIDITVHILPKRYDGTDSILLFKDDYYFLNKKYSNLL